MVPWWLTSVLVIWSIICTNNVAEVNDKKLSLVNDILLTKAFLSLWINWLHILSARKGCHLRLFHWMTLCILIRQNFSHQKAHTDIFYQLQDFNARNDLSQEIILVFSDRLDSWGKPCELNFLIFFSHFLFKTFKLF